MFSFSHIFKGILIGAACVLPGISGGTLALTMGVYETLLKAVSHLFSDSKNSLKTLFPFLIGCMITLICFPYTADYLISEHPFLFAMTIGGFLLGGTPMLLDETKSLPHTRRQSYIGALFFFLFLFFTIFFSAAQAPLTVGKPLPLLPSTLLITFLLGLVYSVTMIIPGVSGSLLLMMFGYYYSLLETAKTLMDGIRLYTWNHVYESACILLPFFLGLFLGGFSLSSCITWLFERYRFPTYHAVLGMIAASLFTIFHHMDIFSCLPKLSIIELLCGIFLFFGSIILTKQLET